MNNIRFFSKPDQPVRISAAKRPPGRDTRRYGRGLVEVIVVVCLLGFAIMLVLMALPRGRESSRMVGCQKNLMQIGLGLQMYHQAHRQYPVIPTLGGSAGDGPIKAMLDAFVIPDLLEIKDPTKPPRPTRIPTRGTRIAGLACPSDTSAMAGMFAPTISYRANTGDNPNGLGGPFQPGRTTTIAEVDAADGASYTAAFAERLVGDGQNGQISLANYATSPGTVLATGCPDASPDRWKGDAGSDWAEASWRSALYSHVLIPGAAPSCISADGKTALMGASSGHSNRVNVLLLDGSLRGIKLTISPKVWQALGTVGSPSENPAP